MNWRNAVRFSLKSFLLPQDSGFLRKIKYLQKDKIKFLLICLRLQMAFI